MEIKISTKFEIGQKVYVIHDNHIYECQILMYECGFKYNEAGICVNINRYETHCKEFGYRTFVEDRLFSTKDELIKTLLNE